MFRHEGPSRSVYKNTVLAAYLACTAGFVNSGGFVVVGSFTSHVTGSVGRLGNDLAARDVQAALSALLLVVSFFVGAFVASVILASDIRSRSTAYGIALLVEAAALATFVLVTAGNDNTGARTLDVQAAILCFAMGVQNSLVTRLSGAVVRTTHLTGVVTDLGIETAHWVHWLLDRRRSLRVSLETRGRSKPAAARTLLLLTITGSFVVGSVVGASMMLHTHGGPMLVPATAVFAASLYALLDREAGAS